MIYFDADVLIHFLLPQDVVENKQGNLLYQSATEKNEFFISLLCLQETAFVLHKLGQESEDIEYIL